MFLSLPPRERKKRLKRDRDKERRDEGAMRQGRSERQFHNCSGAGLRRFGGSGDFRTALGAICQKSKPFPISASLTHSLSLSLPSLSITTSAFFLPCHTPSPPLFPTYFSLMHHKISLHVLLTPGCSFFYLQILKRTRRFLIYHDKWS